MAKVDLAIAVFFGGMLLFSMWHWNRAKPDSPDRKFMSTMMMLSAAAAARGDASCPLAGRRMAAHCSIDPHPLRDDRHSDLAAAIASETTGYLIRARASQRPPVVRCGTDGFELHLALQELDELK